MADRGVTCERCGASFGCGVGTADCWCAAAALPADARAEMAREFDDCLCPACLKVLAPVPAQGSSPPGGQIQRRVVRL
jgi:hypothetical protein